MSVNKPTFYTSFHGRKPDFIFAEHTLPAGGNSWPGIGTPRTRLLSSGQRTLGRLCGPPFAGY